jgi:hypothetical protein
VDDVNFASKFVLHVSSSLRIWFLAALIWSYLRAQVLRSIIVNWTYSEHKSNIFSIPHSRGQEDSMFMFEWPRKMTEMLSESTYDKVRLYLTFLCLQTVDKDPSTVVVGIDIDKQPAHRRIICRCYQGEQIFRLELCCGCGDPLRHVFAWLCRSWTWNSLVLCMRDTLAMKVSGGNSEIPFLEFIKFLTALFITAATGNYYHKALAAQHAGFLKLRGSSNQASSSSAASADASDARDAQQRQPSKADIKSKIDEVKAIFPDYGNVFIAACLEVCRWVMISLLISVVTCSNGL